MDLPASNTSLWWTFLCLVAVVNVVAWSYAAVRVVRTGSLLPGRLRNLQRWQLALSAAYVLGCAYRSFLPVYDVQRLVLVDSWWSSVIVGRSVAMVAELCFAGQWALLLRQAAAGAAAGRVGMIAALVLPLIAVAEMFSWHAVLTTSNFGHIVEETLWGTCAVLVVGSMLHLARKCPRELRPLLVFWSLAGAVYAIFMFSVDVPMYWSRWVADEALGRNYLSLSQGVVDVSTRWVVSHDWNRWRTEVPWMSLYFSVAVWLSISLVHTVAARGLPAPRQEACELAR